MREHDLSHQSHPLETATLKAARWALVGSALGIVLLAVPAELISRHRLVVVTLQLTAIVVSATFLAVQLNPTLDRPYFSGRRNGWLLSAVALIALVTGYAALVTLATSAGLRYEPSLQFLQLLSALDVAWSAAALGIGVSTLSSSKRTGILAALVLDVICVLSIWNYLRVVGFDDAGGWLVSNRDLLTLVIPFDVVAAVTAIGSLLVGSRRQSATNSGAV